MVLEGPEGSRTILAISDLIAADGRLAFATLSTGKPPFREVRFHEYDKGQWRTQSVREDRVDDVALGYTAGSGFILAVVGLEATGEKGWQRVLRVYSEGAGWSRGKEVHAVAADHELSGLAWSSEFASVLLVSWVIKSNAGTTAMASIDPFEPSGSPIELGRGAYAARPVALRGVAPAWVLTRIDPGGQQETISIALLTANHTAVVASGEFPNPFRGPFIAIADASTSVTLLGPEYDAEGVSTSLLWSGFGT